MNNKLPIYVINLETARERRNSIVSHLTGLGLNDFRIFPAVFGAAIPADKLALSYNDARARESAGRAFTAGEIGCSLSHIGVYRAIIENDQRYALVLEDDANIFPGFLKILENLTEWLDSSQPRIILCSPLRSFLDGSCQALSHSHRIVEIHRAWNAHGYCLNKAAAMAMITVNFPVHLMADDWMSYQKFTHIKVVGVDPFVIGVNELAAQSQLEGDRKIARQKPKQSTKFKAKRFFSKLISHFIEYFWLRPRYGIRHHKGK